MSTKVVEISKVEQLIKSLKKSGKKIVLVGGCFDVLHPGHIFFLSEAKKQGNTLLIMLEGDPSIRKRKGAARPINSAKERINKLIALKTVDYVLLLPELKTDREYFTLVKRLEPDIIAVTVGDPAKSKKVKQAKTVGGEVFEIEKLPEYSTTSLINKKI